MGEFEASHQEHLGEVSQAQFVPDAPQHNQEYNVCWELKMVIRSASALVECASTLRTAEDPVAQRRFLGQLACLSACTVGAIHMYSSVKDYSIRIRIPDEQILTKYCPEI